MSKINIFLQGDDFFQRFSMNPDGSRVVFKKGSDVEKFMSRLIDIDEWPLQVNQHLLHYNGDLLPDKGHIFIIESQQFRTVTTPIRHITVLVSI